MNRSRNGRAHRLRPLAFVVVLFATAGCRSGPKSTEVRGGGVSGGATVTAPASFFTPSGAVYDVKYTSNTVRIDLPTIQKTLKSVSGDGQIFLFDGADPQIRGVAPGKVLFLEHIGVLRVTGVANKDGQVVVVTIPAGLTDFIQDGKIRFSMPVDFRQLRSALALEPKWPSFLPTLRGWLGPLEPVYASGGGTTGLIGSSTNGQANGWSYTVSGRQEGMVSHSRSTPEKI